MAKSIKAAQLERKAHNYGTDAGFVANVILCHHIRPARKLAGLLRLLESGASVRVATFGMDVLIVNGERREWSSLETA